MDRRLIAVIVAVIVIVPSVCAAVILTRDDGGSGWVDDGALPYTFSTYNYALGHNVSMTSYYTDGYFDNPSDKYNPCLATFALTLTMACGYSSSKGHGPDSVLGLLEDIGCTERFANQSFYDGNPDENSVELAIGSKTYGGFTLIFVATKGLLYSEIEFGSNFLFGAEGRHSGFVAASENIKGSLREYISDRGISGNVKVLLSGYSRTAAVSNLAAADIVDAISSGDASGTLGDVTLGIGDLYCFCFECPRGGYYDGTPGTISPGNLRYNGIFCFVDPKDIVPNLPPSDYGMVRYGKLISLPSDDEDAAGKSLETIGKFIGEDEARYYDVSGFIPSEKIPTMEDLSLEVKNFMVKSTVSREYYAANIEADLSYFVYMVLDHPRLVTVFSDNEGGYLKAMTALVNEAFSEDFDTRFGSSFHAAAVACGISGQEDAIMAGLSQAAKMLNRYMGGSFNLFNPLLASLLANIPAAAVPHMPGSVFGYIASEDPHYL
ncbi:MAG: hypothetical protein E7Z63_01370 [Thermoplasmata archaeon]|nr:hypothetical protein [Thermoplasmata archaeon]